MLGLGPVGPALAWSVARGVSRRGANSGAVWPWLETGGLLTVVHARVLVMHS